MNRARFLYCFNDKGHFRRFLWGLVALAVLAGMGLFLVPAAYALSFSCSTGKAVYLDEQGNILTQNSVPLVGNMFTLYDTQGAQVYDNNGRLTTIDTSHSSVDNGDPYVAGGVCSNSLGIFGRVLCFFKSTVGQTVSQMYCGFQHQLQGTITTVFMVFIAVLGIMIMTGMMQFSVREGMMTVLKIALIYAFATNATWGIGVGYAFFMGLAEQGSAIVLGAGIGSGGSGGAALTTPDQVIGGLLNMATLGSANGNPISLPSTLGTHCAMWLISFFFLLFVFVPLVAVFIGNVIIQYLWLYVRALLGYLTALVLIGFLFMLAPLFVCFALFQVTRSLFEQWLKYLTSFSLQMVIVFAFLVVLNMIPVGDFFMEIVGLLREYDTTAMLNHTATTSTFCGICDYTINHAVTLADHFVDASRPLPITCVAGSTKVLEFSQLLTSQDLIQAIIAQATALFIIGSIMQDLMVKAPEFAKDLTGRLPFAAALGGGAGASFQNDASSLQYPGLDSVQNFTESLPERILGGMNPAGMLRRTLVAGGALAGTGMLGNTFRRLGIGGAAVGPNAPAGHTDGTDHTSVQSTAKTTDQDNDKDDNKKAADGPRRIDGMPMLMAYQTAIWKYDAANGNLENSQEGVQVALDNIERLKEHPAGEAAMRDAQAQLKQANDLYLAAWTDANDSQRNMLAIRKELSPFLPQEKLAQLQGYMSDSDTDANPFGGAAGTGGKNTSGASAHTDDSNAAGFTPTDLRGYADQAIQHLQMLMRVRMAQVPMIQNKNNMSVPDGEQQSRLDYAQGLLDQAMGALDNAKTTGDVEEVIRQLYVIENALR